MNRQNGLVMLDIFGGISDALILEAENDTFPRRRISVRRLIPIIAAAVIAASLLGIGASAAVRYFITHRENALHEYHGDPVLVSELEKRAGEPIVCENAHLRMTVDTVMSDEVYIRCTATLEGLDDEGRAFISDKLILPEEAAAMTESQLEEYFVKGDPDFDQFMPFMQAYSSSGKRLTGFNSTSDNMFGKKGNDAEAVFTFGINKSAFAGESEVRVQCNQLKKYFTNRTPGIFEGMEFTLPTASNFDTLVLKSADGSTLWLSETCLYENMRAEESEDFSFSLFFTDGGSREDIKEPFTRNGLYPLSDVERIEFGGREYLPEEIIAAER